MANYYPIGNPPQGRFRYAGVWADGAFEVTRSGSTQPDIIRADFVLGAAFPQYGDIEIWYGDKFIRMPNCRVVREDITGGSGGRYRTVQFEDRRWLWKYKYAWGNPGHAKYLFNTYRLKLNTTYFHVIRDLLFSAGDVLAGAMPMEAFLTPTYNKDGDLIDVYPVESMEFHFDGRDSAQCIEEALASSQMQLHLGWDDKVRLWGPGYGRERPQDVRVLDYTVSRTPPMVPSKLLFEFPVAFENDFVLEAAGYNWNTNGPGRIAIPLRLLNYGPLDANGRIDWTLADPPMFTRIPDKRHRELARRTIFKTWIIKYPIKDPIKLDFKDIGGVPFVADDFIDPADEQVEFVSDREYNIYGYFANFTIGRINNYTVQPVNYQMDGTEFHGFTDLQARGSNPLNVNFAYEGEIEFDAKNEIIKTRDPLVFVNRNPAGAVQKNTYYPGKLVFRSIHNLRKKLNREYLRYVLPVDIASPFAAPGVSEKVKVSDTEIVVRRDPQFKPNFTTYAAYSAEYTTRYLSGKRMVESATIPMIGFCFDINTDGRIASVTFSRDEDGRCTTSVQWQKENPLFSPAYVKATSDAIIEGILYRSKFVASAAAIRAKKQQRVGWNP